MYCRFAGPFTMRFSWDVSSRQGWGSHVEVHRTHVKECTCLQTAIYYKSVQIKTLGEDVEPQVTGIVHAMYEEKISKSSGGSKVCRADVVVLRRTRPCVVVKCFRAR